MTPEAQRIAIAEACGWIDAMKERNDIRGFRSSKEASDFGYCGFCESIPDYLNDLNAMAEAEKTFKDDAVLWHRYASLLDKDYVNQPYTIGATAAQRAKAFLKTIGKWQD